MKMKEEKFFEIVDDVHGLDCVDRLTTEDWRVFAFRLGIELEKEEEILPCPWCGGVNQGEVLYSGELSWLYCSDANCRSIGPHAEGGRAEAIAAWNRRTPTPPPKEEG